MAIEVLVSLLKLNIDKKNKTYINSTTHSIIDNKDFQKYYKDSIYLEFNKNEYETMLEYKTLNYQFNNKIIFITNFESHFFLDYEFIKKQSNITIYIITKCLSNKNRVILNKTISKLYKLVDIKCIE